MPIVVPPAAQGLGPTKLYELFHPIAQYIAAVRESRGLPPIADGTGDILLGNQFVAQEGSAPRIVVVPTSTRFEAARKMGTNPAPFYLRWLGFEAHFWGDDGPEGSNSTYAHDAALELEREFLGGLALYGGNTPNLKISNGHWVNAGEASRSGRLYVLPFEVGTPVTFEPDIALPFAQTPGGNGIVVSATVRTQFSDGTTVVNGTFTVPTPTS